MNGAVVRFSKPLGAAVAAGVCASMIGAPAALAGNDQEGKSTLEQTIKRSKDGWRKLTKQKGEPYTVRTDITKAKKGRSDRRSSLTFFGQLTDPQIADEMSPARLELVDPISGPTSAAWRPQEALGVRVFDSTIRNMDANRVSRVSDSRGKYDKLRFAILTGDIADSAQKNEVQMFRETLEGGTVDPFSGKLIKTEDQAKCRVLGGQLTDDEVKMLNKRVKKRQYTGVQNFKDWPGQGNDRYQGFWDPNIGATGDMFGYGSFPKYPNLMDAAQKKLKSKGLGFPWYITRGNHDTLVQGNVPANQKVSVLSIEGIATGCSKPWPNKDVNPEDAKGLPGDQVFQWLSQPPQFNGVINALTKMQPVPPDPDRRYVSKLEFKDMLKGSDDGHGFGYVSKQQLKASNQNATYYGFNRGKFRIIMLDTNAEGGGASGNVDDPQFQWLKKQLDKYSTVEVRNGKIKRDSGKNKMIIISSHHTLGTMDNPTPDEAAGVCTDPMEAGCDSDPRNSEPLHFGRSGKQPLDQLLLRYPNVVAYVNGHTHHNAVSSYTRPKGSKYRSGFWQINTASHVDWPQQSRTVQFMDNHDGTLSIFGTILNTAASVKAPKPGTNAMKMSNSQLASLSRQLAANDPQMKATTDGGGPGKKKDRNVELLLKDPRVLWQAHGNG
ncbi:MAG: metallophosphoesterase [Candidatus Nanopelagicales bacterium]